MMKFSPTTKKAVVRTKVVWLVFVLLIIILAVFFLLRPGATIGPLNLTTIMNITSPAFANNAIMPELYTCRSVGSHPPLAWSGLPVGAQTLALIVDDPDTPTGDFVHWIVWNIPADLAQIAEGAVPVGAIEGGNSLGQTGFVAPCPPAGTHHYQFKLYALDTKLTLDNTTTKAELVTALTGHILAETQLIGLVSAAAPVVPSAAD